MGTPGEDRGFPPRPVSGRRARDTSAEGHRGSSAEGAMRVPLGWRKVDTATSSTAPPMLMPPPSADARADRAFAPRATLDEAPSEPIERRREMFPQLAAADVERMRRFGTVERFN